MTDRTHLQIATVHANTVESIVKSIQATTADRIEVRLDALWQTTPDSETAADQLLTIVDATQTPLVATLRPARQGGQFQGDETVRLSLLAAAAKCGFHTLDVEADLEHLPQVVQQLRADAKEIIASTHLPSKTPSKDEGIMALQAMQDSIADRQKLAFPAGSFLDYLRALELAHRFHGVNGRHAAIPLGFGGAMGRALLPLAGASLTYGHADESAPAVSGQPALAHIQAVWKQWGITAEDLDQSSAQWLAVVGTPVHHSQSPAIHNSWLRAAGRPERYGALDVPDSIGAVRLLFGVAQRIGLVGAGVTAPLKVHALDASVPDDTAKAVGAANTVRFRGGRIESTNTDSTGLQALMANHPGTVAVLGAGGVARAAIHAAQTLGRTVTFVSRDAAKAKSVQEAFGASWVSWENRDQVQADIWIQCTSIGSDEGDASPLPAGAKPTLAIEMVYASGTTEFERQATNVGATVLSGLDVLRNQAAAQYKFWTGEDPPGTTP